MVIGQLSLVVGDWSLVVGNWGLEEGDGVDVYGDPVAGGQVALVAEEEVQAALRARRVARRLSPSTAERPSARNEVVGKPITTPTTTAASPSQVPVTN